MVVDKKNNSPLKTKKRDITFLVLLITIVILINFIGSFVFKRFDLTSEKRYTLAESTIKLLKNLDDDVNFKVYLHGNFNPSFSRLKNETKEILDEFRAYSNNQIQYEFITPGEGLNKEEAVNIEKELYNKGLVPEEVVEKKQDKTSQTLIWPGAIASHKGKEAVWQIFKRQIGIAPEECINNSVQELEYSLTNTIRKLQRDKKQEITFIEGHSEIDTLHQYDFMRSLSEYYNVNRTLIKEKLNALQDCDAIVITQPDSTFSDKDKYVIDQYIMRGGKVLWLIDPVNINLDTLYMKGYSIGLNKQLNIEDMLFKYGVRLNPVLIQDLQCAKIPINVGFKKGQPNFKQFPWLYSPLVLPEGSHPIVKNLDLIKFDYLSTLDTVTAKGIKKTILLKTSRYTKIQQTPARLSLGMVQLKVKESQFNSSYQNIACLLEGSFNSFVEYRIPTKLLNDSLFKYVDKGKPTKMIVVADGDVARNEFNRENGNIYPLGFDKYSQQTFANKTFLLNCVNYLLDDEGMLQLRSREVKLRLLDKKKVNLQHTKWQLINVVMPLLILILFAYIQFYVRKKKYSSLK